ncbi:GNAT family N-acetyltransferase [Blastococcus mobilis]|uniref:Acetyltransferase (GNAT) domain-containing protein n=1 Tax=Blastococcus mobilis TaxID=1938746 RepID=A0A238Z2H7_9ACTN|nr:GNAT family N-acetyltransferase [Blastococcus mobilis]SNR77053.1 Acetyltransferase (GNAT) domain-containing protein [Blastococcus mobilis]
MASPELQPPSSAPEPASVASVGDVEVVPLDEWDALIARLGGLDTYTRAAYHRASALLEVPGTEPVLLHFRHRTGEMALPLLLRLLPDGTGWDATSAYGYGGPTARTGGARPAFGRALDTWARANGVVATFLRCHPLLDNHRLLPARAETVLVGSTVAWDVSPGRDLTAGMHPHHRRAARRAERAGLEVAVVPRPDSLADFRELYVATMRRQQAHPFFYFPTEYWEALLADGGTLQPVLVEGRLEGRLVASLLCFAEGSRLHYHLGASDEAARSIGASNRCFLAAAEWAQARGMTLFHLGGGVGGSAESSLYVFKHRYDPQSEPLPFHIAKIVHDRLRYRELAGTDDTDGFFPPWRAP